MTHEELEDLEKEVNELLEMPFLFSCGKMAQIMVCYVPRLIELAKKQARE